MAKVKPEGPPEAAKPKTDEGLPEKQPKSGDPAHFPEWVHDEGGSLVPYRLPSIVRAEQIEVLRIAKEKARYEQGFPVAGHYDEQDDEDER